jgi:hypothetical protein
MTMAFRVIASTVVLALVLGGPMAPLVRAQQPTETQQTAQVPPAPPAPPPAQTAPAPTPQPEMFPETIRTRDAERHQGAYAAGAAIANVFYIPGKGVLCAIGSAVGIALLGLTFGSGYKTATAAASEGCGGRWVLRGDDLRPERPHADRY